MQALPLRCGSNSSSSSAGCCRCLMYAVLLRFASMQQLRGHRLLAQHLKLLLHAWCMHALSAACLHSSGRACRLVLCGCVDCVVRAAHAAALARSIKWAALLLCCFVGSAGHASAGCVGCMLRHTLQLPCAVPAELAVSCRQRGARMEAGMRAVCWQASVCLAGRLLTRAAAGNALHMFALQLPSCTA